MAACDAVVTASGTVTLELAILEVPMIVVYKLAPLTYQLGKRLVKVDFFSLVNLIAGYAAVGAFYFLISAVWLTVSQLRRKTA